LHFTHCRGETFCKEFAKLREVWSLLPDGVWHHEETSVKKKLGMVNPFILSQSPTKQNIYSIVKKNEGIE